MTKKLILATASPRRRRLLKQIGLDFQVIPSSIDEDQIVDGDPLAKVKAIALSKARDVAVSQEKGLRPSPG